MADADAYANPILEALIDDLGGGRLGDADAVQRVQRNVDLVRAEIEEYAALHAEAAAELAQAHWRLAEVVSSAAARRGLQVPPEGLDLVLEEDDPEAAAADPRALQVPPEGLVLLLVEDEDDPGPEVAAAARHELQVPPEGLVLLQVEDEDDDPEVAAAARHALQVPPEGVVLLRLEDVPELAAHVAAYVEAADRVELIKQNQLLLVQALVFLLTARAVAFAHSRVRLLPGVLGTVAAAYALAYVVSWGAVVPGPTSILWIAVLVVCFLFGLPVVGNLP